MKEVCPGNIAAGGIRLGIGASLDGSDYGLASWLFIAFTGSGLAESCLGALTEKWQNNTRFFRFKKQTILYCYDFSMWKSRNRHFDICNNDLIQFTRKFTANLRDINALMISLPNQITQNVHKQIWFLPNDAHYFSVGVYFYSSLITHVAPQGINCFRNFYLLLTKMLLSNFNGMYTIQNIPIGWRGFLHNSKSNRNCSR